MLWNGHLPTVTELEEMRLESRGCRPLPGEIMTILRQLPKDASPTAVMRSAISILAHYDPESEDNSPDCATAARLAGSWARSRPCWRISSAFATATIRSSSVRDLDHAANFLWMLNGVEPDPLAAKALDQYLLLLADHEFNASTFAARVTASTDSDLHSAITSAMGTLKGPLHGAAVQEAMEQFLEIGELENVEPWFEKGKSDRPPRDGHRPPRVQGARPARRAAGAEPGDDGRTRPASAAGSTSRAAWKSIAREDPYFRERNLSANVDFYSAPLLYSLGIPVDTFTCMFAMSRIVGWTAHVFEQMADNRLIRPQSNYVGQHNLPWVPIEDRG